MKIHLQKILDQVMTDHGSFAKFRFAKFGQQDRIFGDLSLDVGSD